MASVFRRYILPGLVFQSVIIGGGYGTGREIAEFFLAHGALGGLLGMAVTAISWAIVLAIAFEFARVTKSYNYRAFFRALLGPFWRVFEIVYLLIILLVLSVLGSAAGEMVATAFGVPAFIGSIVLLAAVAGLAFLGSGMIERVLAAWSFLLYGVYAVFFIWVAVAAGPDIGAALATGEVSGAWALDGVRYAAYNLIAIGAVLFVLPYLQTRKEAIGSGLVAGFAGIVPGLLVLLALLARFPGIEADPVPVLSLLGAVTAFWFIILFQLVLFGTFIETGVGLIHAVNERVADAARDAGRSFPQWGRLVLAAGLTGGAVFLAGTVGIIDLIAKGYGALSYAFIAIVVVPLLTIGVYRISQSDPETMEALNEAG